MVKNKNYINLTVFFIITIFLSEICLIIFTTGNFDNIKNILLFSIVLGISIAFIVSLIGIKKFGYYLIYFVLILIYICFISQILLFRSFGFFYPPETVFNMAGDVIGSYSGSIINSILSGFIPIIILLIPICFFSAFKKRLNVGYEKKKILWIIIFIAGLVLHFLTTVTMDEGKNGEISDKDYYTSSFDFNEGVKRFGFLETLRLNFYYSVNGVPQQNIINLKKEQKNTKNILIEAKYHKYNLDFNLIKNNTSDKQIEKMCDYFSSVIPSKKNEYTGMFKGKNLIFICAEAFSPYSVSKERTPTLYKMMNEGFVFSDYYQPSFGESTSGGEYSLLLSQVPKKDSGEKGMSMKLSCNENLKYSMPAFFKNEGYYTNGFHNNSYTYYSRDITHPKMGMNWYGCNGCVTSDGSYFDLAEYLSIGWPRSDKEMISATVGRYIDNNPFFTYYLTVSGHNNYSFEENTAANKNKNTVKNLPYSEKVKAYLASQFELESALTELILTLSDAGILDDTVIALSNDHYPYGLSPLWQGNGGKDYISELYGKKVKTLSEREKGAFFIYCTDMKSPVKVTKPTCSFDVLPTILNLFGIEFDSRLFAGRDALSKEEGLVFFSNYSWKTDKAEYNAEDGKLTKFSQVTDEYVKEKHSEVKNRIQYSKMLRQKEFFKVLKNYNKQFF